MAHSKHCKTPIQALHISNRSSYSSADNSEAIKVSQSPPVSVSSHESNQRQVSQRQPKISTIHLHVAMWSVWTAICFRSGCSILFDNLDSLEIQAAFKFLHMDQRR